MKKVKQAIAYCQQKVTSRGSVLTASMLMTTPAYAGVDISALTNALQGLLDILSGTTANVTAAIAIAGLGYGWLSGQMTLVKAASISFGIGLIIGAADIVDALT